MIILSNHLTIVDLVSLYLTNYLIVRKPFPKRINALIQRSHAVLANLSTSYPSLWGMFSRVTQPSAARHQLHSSLESYHSHNSQVCQENGEAMLPLDLHVLGMPPAFILSQDQTLR